MGSSPPGEEEGNPSSTPPEPAVGNPTPDEDPSGSDQDDDHDPVPTITTSSPNEGLVLWFPQQAMRAWCSRPEHALPGGVEAMGLGPFGRTTAQHATRMFEAVSPSDALSGYQACDHG